jgi:3-mercaptopyruvate sulfurtransferase SseA
MANLLRAAVLCIAGAALGIVGNRFTPHPAPLGEAVVATAETAGAACQGDAASGARISVEEAKPLCIACTAVFVDARSAQEYAVGHVTGAVHLAPGEAVDPLLPALRAAPVVIVYDRDGECAGANQVAATLRGRGMRDVRVLTGAWPEWLARGGPGESGSCGICTAERR